LFFWKSAGERKTRARVVEEGREKEKRKGNLGEIERNEWRR
jgi:hypothetical protein